MVEDVQECAGLGGVGDCSGVRELAPALQSDRLSRYTSERFPGSGDFSPAVFLFNGLLQSLWPSFLMIDLARCSLISLCLGTGCDCRVSGFVYQS